VIALEGLECASVIFGDRNEICVDLCQSAVTIDIRLATAEQIEVGAVKN
jgi:hypothetical protein